MATSYGVSNETDFELRIAQVRHTIQSHFSDLSKNVKEREVELLRKVDNILTEFKEKVKEKDKMNVELDKTKEFIEKNIQLAGLMSLQQDLVKKIEDSLDKMKSEIRNWKITFTCDESLIQKVKQHGRVSVRSPSHKQKLPPIDYSTQLQPLWSFGSIGTGPGQFSRPWGIAIDPDSNNVFIADINNKRIQVFSQDFTYLYKFGDDRMSNPIGITIYQEKVFVLQHGVSCLLVYKLNGDYIQTVGEGQLTNPYGFDINCLNGDIYICDTSNNRVQVFSHEFNFKTSLWENVLDQPVDINLTDESIFVLDQRDPCIHIYSYNYVLIKSIISKGQASSSYGFSVDRKNCICMAETNCIMVFDIQGTLIHQFGGFTDPKGIAFTSTGAIIICSSTPNKCIQIW